VHECPPLLAELTVSGMDEGAFVRPVVVYIGNISLNVLFSMRKNMKIIRVLLVLLFAATFILPSAPAQAFRIGERVEALPFGNDWYPCIITRSAPNYMVKCTNIDGTTSDYGVSSNRVRPDSGRAAAVMADRWAKRFPIGSRVEAAPYGEQNGYHSCVVLNVKGNGATIGLYHLKCDMGYETGPAELDVGAIDHIRAAAHTSAAAPSRPQPAMSAGRTLPAAQPNRPQNASSPGVVPQGVYQCWSSGRANLMLNFSITGVRQYQGANGRAGTFSFDPASQRITFSGGSLDGVMPAGFYSIYHAPQGRPTVSFRNSSGNEAAFCQKR